MGDLFNGPACGARLRGDAEDAPRKRGPLNGHAGETRPASGAVKRRAGIATCESRIARDPAAATVAAGTAARRNSLVQRQYTENAVRLVVRAGGVEQAVLIVMYAVRQSPESGEDQLLAGGIGGVAEVVAVFVEDADRAVAEVAD